MTVFNIIHKDKHGDVVRTYDDVFNTLHVGGEQFILQCLFLGGSQSNSYIPPYYFVGLDNRTTITVPDTMSNLIGEPTSSSGYQRQSVSSTTGFTISTTTDGNYRANTAVVTFRAIGGSIGPVSNIFLSNGNTTSDILIASAALSTPNRTLTDGETVSMQFGMTLRGSC